MANRVEKLEGRLPSIMGYLKSGFLGGYYICDSNGQILKEMDQHQEQGVIVSQITLNLKYKATTPLKRYGKIWAVPMPWFSFVKPMTQPWREKPYAKSNRRA